MTLRARAIAGVIGLHASAGSRKLTGALERLARPFERAVSRLIEMQSAEYLSREHKP